MYNVGLISLSVRLNISKKLNLILVFCCFNEFLFSEKVLADLINGDDVMNMLQKQNILRNKSNMMEFKEVLRAIGRYDLVKELSICLARGEYLKIFDYLHRL